MKSAAEKLRVFHQKPPPKFSSPLLSNRKFTTSTITNTTTTTTNSSVALTEDEMKQINAVIPRLCSSNHLKDAINLISAALSTANPPLSSLPLPILINRLVLEPDLTYPMHFLNAVKYNPTSGTPLVLIPIAKMFASNFFQKNRPQKAVKIFQWVSRPDFPGGVVKDLGFYAILIDGFCRNGMVLDALRVLRVMVSENLVVGSEVRNWVYRGLLKEARVGEALELNAALDCGTKEVGDLLDRIIANWVD